MATYLGTHGSKIQNYTTDPDNPNTGEVWYNETANTLKFQQQNVTTSGSWRTGGTMNTARRDLAGAGIQTSALAFGGTPYSAITESYDGTSWTEVNDLSTGRVLLGGSGASNTAALAFGGFTHPPSTHRNETELWNGSNWTEVNNLNTARYRVAGSGTSTSTLAFGGNLPPNNVSGVTEEWNGTNWTEVNDLNTAREGMAASGSTEAMLGFGGYVDPEEIKH